MSSKYAYSIFAITVISLKIFEFCSWNFTERSRKKNSTWRRTL